MQFLGIFAILPAVQAVAFTFALFLSSIRGFVQLVSALFREGGAESDGDDGDEEVGRRDHEGAEAEHALVAVSIVLREGTDFRVLSGKIYVSTEVIALGDNLGKQPIIQYRCPCLQ